jgi:CRISPR-associated protein Cas1
VQDVEAAQHTDQSPVGVHHRRLAEVTAQQQLRRQVLLRAARESTEPADKLWLTEAAARLVTSLERLKLCRDLNEVRGAEGEAARAYFDVFGYMVRVDREHFNMDGRTRRPPRDRVNAAISFLYALVRSECSAALEGVGLDPQVGYLHTLRPGRPGLALDLMEEFRPVLADRLAITLVNRRQLKAEHFDSLPGGAVHLNDDGRKVVLTAYQRRKEETLQHRVLKQELPLGLVPHVQARLLARHLRGDLKDYPPFLYR